MTEVNQHEAEQVFGELMEEWWCLDSKELAQQLVDSYRDLSERLERNVLNIVLTMVVSEINDKGREMKDLIGKPVPDNAYFYYICEDEKISVYQLLSIYLYVVAGVVVEVVTDEDDLCDETNMTGAFY